MRTVKAGPEPNLGIAYVLFLMVPLGLALVVYAIVRVPPYNPPPKTWPPSCATGLRNVRQCPL